MYQRLGIFVDVQNMYYSAKNMYQKKLNFDALLKKIVGGRAVIRAIAYIVQSPDVDQSHFINVLHQSGYEVKSKDLKVRPDGTAKGDWDMGIAIDSISIASRVDVVAIVSGDGDFCDLVRHLKARGIRCEVYAFHGSVSEELRMTATEFIPLDSDVLLY
ncbi:NYN domain-containing protein [bacterium]|nr:NYN domain-containing protein [bacterium]